MTKTFPMIAKTLPGLEPVLEQELTALGANNIQIGRRMVSYEGDLKMLYKSNLYLRTALKVLRPIYEFDAEDIDILYTTLLNFDWSQWLTADMTFAVDAVVYSSTFKHSRYVVYKTKDAIVDYFREQTGGTKRPSVKLSNPQLIFHLHIAEQHVTLCLDSSGESLHKRGYRMEQDRAPINEVLAAGILLKAGWHGQCDLMDPFCGSGTFLVEAALIATGTPPGIYRESYPFERWPDFDSELCSEVYNDDSTERSFDYHIYGSDLSPQAIAKAKRNVTRSGMSRYIDLSVGDFADQHLPHPEAETDPKCLLVMNPPYGERLSDYDLEQLYSMIGRTLKFQFAGAQAWIIAHQAEHFHAIGLKHDLREELYNGSLPCELRGYTLFEGKHKEYKEQIAQREESPQRRERGEAFHRGKGQEPRRHRAAYDKPAYSKGRGGKPYEKPYDRSVHRGTQRTKGPHPAGSSSSGYKANIQTFGSDETFVHEAEVKDNE